MSEWKKKLEALGARSFNLGNAASHGMPMRQVNDKLAEINDQALKLAREMCDRIEQLEHEADGDWQCDSCHTWFLCFDENFGHESNLCQNCKEKLEAPEGGKKGA